MRTLLKVEMLKLRSARIWWIIAAGAVLPGVITCLSFWEESTLVWREYIHVAMLIFNVQSLLTFSAFAAVMSAREYEENTMEMTLCYPYPRHHFLIAKLMIMVVVIAVTVAMFALFTIGFGMGLVSEPLSSAMLWLFIRVLLQLIFMHVLIIPAAFLAAMMSRMALPSVMLGMVSMCICMMLYNTTFIQFIPPAIPFVLSDHLLGMDVMSLLPNYTIHWSILGAYFVLLLFAGVRMPMAVQGKE